MSVFAIKRGYYGGHTILLKIGSETDKTVTAVESVDNAKTWTLQARRIVKGTVLARYATEELALAAQVRAKAAWVSHDLAVNAARTAYAAASQAQRDAFNAALTSDHPVES